MRGFKWLALGMGLGLLAGCSSHDGPMAPQGPLLPGDGTGYTYHATVTPDACAGTYTLIASMVHIGIAPENPASTVYAYLRRGNADYILLPAGLEEGGGTTLYDYTTSEGSVTAAWNNSAGVTPTAFDFWVSVTNQQ